MTNIPPTIESLWLGVDHHIEEGDELMATLAIKAILELTK